VFAVVTLSTLVGTRLVELMPRSWGCFWKGHDWRVIFEPVLVNGELDHYLVLYERCRKCGKVEDASWS
jgi:hypothetical protein